MAVCYTILVSTRIAPNWSCIKQLVRKKPSSAKGVRVVSLGELCKSDPVPRNFVSRRQFTLSSLNPRDGFFNGRTNTCQLYDKVNESLGGGNPVRGCHVVASDRQQIRRLSSESYDRPHQSSGRHWVAFWHRRLYGASARTPSNYPARFAVSLWRQNYLSPVQNLCRRKTA